MPYFSPPGFTPNIGSTAGALVFADAVSRIIPGATSLSFRDNANAVDNLLISNTGAVSLINTLTLTAPNITTPVFTINSSIANPVITIQPTIPELPAAANNTVYIAGQQPLTMNSAVDSYVAHVRGWGRGSSTAAGQMALRVHFPAGAGGETFTTNYTGSQLAAAINAQTDSTSTAVTPVSGFLANAAFVGLATGVGAGWNVGAFGRAQKSTGANIGVLGSATSLANSEAWNIGVLGVARLAAAISNSGYFLAGTVEPAVGLSSVLTVDSGATAVNLLVGVQNGGTRIIWDSKGNMTYTPSGTAAGVTLMNMTPGAHTAVVAEVMDYNYAAHTITITGGYNLQRFARYAQPTVSAATALTIVTGATVAIDGPPLVAGVGPAAITNKVSLWLASAIATVAGGSPNAAIGIGVTTNAPTVAIYFGSGAPTISAPKGSLYLRTDGTTTNDRAYINSNASTTWTALTTAA